jgi:hypothetical protein
VAPGARAQERKRCLKPTLMMEVAGTKNFRSKDIEDDIERIDRIDSD